MGGMSSAQLIAVNLSEDKVDPVELFHDRLRRDACARQCVRGDQDFDDVDQMDEEYPENVTVVGKKLHGPTFDHGYEDESNSKVDLSYRREEWTC